MFWIIDRAPRDEDTDSLLWIATGRHPGRDDMTRLMAALSAQRIPHQAVRKPPFSNYLVDMIDKDKRVELRPDGLVFAYGSTTLHEVSDQMGWTPGYVDGPPMDECDHHWGRHMLNYGSTIATIGLMAIPNRPVFIRPVDDGKAFAGKIETPETFQAWREDILNIKGWTNCPPETRVIIADPVKIYAEWRLLIVDGQLITSSLYREGTRLRIEEGCPEHISSFALTRVSEWSPRPVFIMDVVETFAGVYIVETNSVSSAGFYAMDVNKYVHAIEHSSLNKEYRHESI